MLDKVDLKILHCLQSAARMPNTELAERVGLSPTACWTRVKRLEAEGVIEKYVAILNQGAVGYPDTVIVEVTLNRHDDEVLGTFEAALSRLPEVLEAYLTTGDYDYFIKVAVAGASGYEEFLREKLYKIPGIQHSRSSFMLRCLKQAYSVEVDVDQTRRNRDGSQPRRSARNR